MSMRTTVRSNQPGRCTRTAQCQVWLVQNNLALFVHSKPCASFFLMISFTLSTHTRTTLELLTSWTKTSTSESGHHQPKLLRKEIGVNEDNSPKQANGTMRKNCAMPSLAVSKQPGTQNLVQTFPPDSGLLNPPKTKMINGIMLVVFPHPFVQVSL